MISYAEAISLVLDNISPLPAIEKPLDEACGLVLAENIQARWDMPPADNSAMDGFAFSFADWKPGIQLPVIGRSYAGHPLDQRVPPATAVRIMTGAPMPQGCDTVVPIEEVEENGDNIKLPEVCKQGQHVRYAAEEFHRDETLLSSGTCLHAGEIGLLASAGITSVRVHPIPQVAILATGDELVELGQQPAPGQIVNSNLHLLAARLKEAGISTLSLGIAQDDETDLDQRLRRGLQTDLLLTSGGVSVGDKDQVQDALNRIGFEKVFWKVAIKPGKPTLFGKIDTQPVFGLPGNPAASAATCEIFIIPALRRLAGHKNALPPRLKVRLAAPVKGGGKRQTFMWGSLHLEAGEYLFTVSNRQGSGQNRSLQGACALLPVPIGSPDLQSGDEVDVLLIRLPAGSNVYR